MEDQFQTPSEKDINTININNNSRRYLKEIANWSQYFAILGFIGCGLIAVVGLIFGTFFSSISNLAELSNAESSTDFNNPVFSIMSSFGMIIYLLLALLYFFPSRYLYISSTKLKNGLKTNQENDIEIGLKNLKSTFKFWGYYTIIIISIYVFFIFFASLLGGVLS